MVGEEFTCRHASNCPLVETQRHEIERIDDRNLELIREVRASHEEIGKLMMTVQTQGRTIAELTATVATLRGSMDELKRRLDDAHG